MPELDLNQWLAGSDWTGWRRSALAGDASSRRYERLTGPKGQTAILMIAPPETCGSQQGFVELARHLTRHDIAAPVIFEWDESAGIMVMSDLGLTDFAQHLTRRPADELTLYEAAVDVLYRLQSVPPPAGLAKMTPSVGAAMSEPAFEWAASDPSQDLKAHIQSEIRALLTEIDPNPSVLSLRDYHAENLIWRAGESGLQRVGVLDFQDAFITHPTYDLASLMRDARRDANSDLIDPLLNRLMPDTPRTDARHSFTVMAVQRNLRIVGIFHALAKRDGKTHYLDFLPRVWRYLIDDLSRPGMEPLKGLIKRAFGKEGTE